MDSDRFEETLRESIKLGTESGFVMPAVCTDNSAANDKSIRRSYSSKRINKRDKGKN